MKVVLTFLICCELLVANSLVFAQAPSQPSSPQIAFGLLDATPIKLRLSRTMSSKDAKTGETVDFEVLEDVKIGDVIVAPRGGIALATVTNAQPSRRMGKGGKLDINIDYLRLVNGEKVALRAIKEGKGGSHTGAMTGAIVASAILFFPAAPLFLFMKGKNITIPKGTEITSYVNGDVVLDPKTFTPPITNAGNAAVQSVSSDASSISLKSNPDGAEIEVDGKFVGSTPSKLQLGAGDHTIKIKKPGFLVWERTITLNSGSNIVIDATLEKTH